MNTTTQKLLNIALLVGCIYEIIALVTRTVPTITRLLRLLGTMRFGKALVWMWCGYVSWHFLEPLDRHA